MCAIDEADEWTMFHAVERKARKAHVCGECGRRIEPGERYHHATGLMYHDSWSVMKQCGQCHAASRWLVEVCNGFLYGYVLEELGEHWDEDWLYHSVSFGKVILASRTRWVRNGERLPVETVRGWVTSALTRVPAKAVA